MKKNSKDKAEKLNWKKELREWGVLVIVAVAVSLFCNSYLVVNAKIPSGSMEETIHPGDRVFGNRLAYLKDEPERFDIVIFRYPDDREQTYIKRVIGLPGETVQILDGKVYIDGAGEPLRDDFIAEKMRGSFGPFYVPENCYFVLGDNRNNSHDSRFWENKYVPKEDILGEAMVRYWPLTAIGGLK